MANSPEKKSCLKRLVGKIWKKSVSSVEQTVNTVEEMTGKAVEVAGDAVVTVGKATGKAVEVVGDGLKNVVAGMVNSSKFLTNAKYRREVGYPWIRTLLRSNWQKVNSEIGESEEMMKILWKYSRGEEISQEEAKAAKEQLYDVMRVVPALAIFALPGGAILLPLLARALPWDLMPSSFRKEVAEKYGEDALSGELKPDEEIPTDETVQPPEDLAQVAQEVQKLEQEKLKENES